MNNTAHDKWSEASTILQAYRDVIFEPLAGNHGDVLIRLGSEKFLREIGLSISGNPASADAVVVNGGGAMNSMWGGLDVLVRYIKAGHKNIVVLPSSFFGTGEQFNEIRDLTTETKCNLILFARDRASYDRLSGAFEPGRNLFLAHDMALFLEATDLATNIRSVQRQKPYALIVERRDKEASTNIAPYQSYAIPFKQAIPLWLKRPVKRFLINRNNKGSALGKRCEADLKRWENPISRIVYGDISHKSMYSFSEFVTLTFHASQVFTTRLHVAILREIFGLPCFLIPTRGEYKKNESVFEFSLAQGGRVKLFDV